MTRYILIILGLALCLCSCGNDVPVKARVSWAGIYTVTELNKNTRSTATPGQVKKTSTWTKIKRTTKIPDTLNTRFGIEYELEGSAFRPLITNHVVWRYPAGGQVDPETRRKADFFEYEKTCFSGTACQAGYGFDEQWEAVPGTWYVEVWVDNKRLIQKAFEVSAAKQTGIRVSSPLYGTTQSK